jgi:hypothetical protein
LKKYFSLLVIACCCFIVTPLAAQTDTVINGKHYQIVDDKKPVKQEIKKKKTIPVDSTFILNNKKLRYYNNWLTAGAGIQQNLTYKRSWGFAGGLDFNFHLKQQYFNLGTMISGEKFGFYNNYQFHLGYGKRFEDRSIHASVFAGVSYSLGYGKVDSVYTRPYQQPGVYVQAEVIKKITYDVGIGTAFFIDWNQEQAILGARIVVYFSGAYEGKKYNDGKE